MSARFCARCGTRLTVGPVAGRERPHCPACGFIVFRNPVPVGLAVVERDGQLLLIRRANPPLQGYWAPPAGHVEIDESVEAATIRETHEEAGVEVALDGLVGVYSQADVGVLIIAYRGRVIGGEARAGEDAAEVAFFAPGALPGHPSPRPGSALDHWFYGVIDAVTAPWKEVRPL
ncbi:MAG: NUDIX domain-containing protein [Ardenticatenaceae bacterium]|nr:NUDIX domain-containing protein [Ardenticatenaceae bacterium]HBY92665.1 ADP-ribose pyrophosphatase [Chloroflexota bacterium]